ncbi:MAG: hypothetical protein KQA40_00025 [Candidatus Aenigmarchaeota archaeon]|nr:hypothetical protein [Candidatus Aenigmarchaeota archaeon]
MNNSIIYDIDMKGGLQILISLNNKPDIHFIENILKDYKPTIRISEGISDYTLIIQTSENVNYDEIISKLKENGYSFSNWSVQTLSASLGTSFLKQAEFVLFVAFIFMSITIFILFKNPLPSFYVVLCGVADIIETFVASQLLGIPLSLATFTGLLLLIGYSVDTDILLTTRMIKGEQSLREEKLKSALKTGLTMTGTSFCAVSVLFLISYSNVIVQIASILMIGLLFDILNTWITNASLIYWYAEKKGI